MASRPSTGLHKGESRVIGGVCSGIAEHFNVDVVLVRVVFVVLALMSGVGFLLYLILWLLMPSAGAPVSQGRDMVAEGITSIGKDITRIGQDLKKPSDGAAAAAEPSQHEK